MGMLSYAPYGLAPAVATLAISSLVLTLNDINAERCKVLSSYSVKSGVSAFQYGHGLCWET